MAMTMSAVLSSHLRDCRCGHDQSTHYRERSVCRKMTCSCGQFQLALPPRPMTDLPEG